MMQNMNETGVNQGTTLRELSLDETEAVVGGSLPIQILTGVLSGGATVGVVAGVKKLGGLLGNGGGKHVPTKSSGKGGGKHVRPSDSKSSIFSWGDGFDAFV
jgi:hypothetical protein